MAAVAILGDVMLIFESEDKHMHADKAKAEAIADAIYELGEARLGDIANITGYTSKRVEDYMLTLTYAWYDDHGVKYRLAETVINRVNHYSWQPTISSIEEMRDLWK